MSKPKPASQRAYPPSKIIEANGYLRVTLTLGFEALVDVEDRSIVSGYRWKALVTKTGHTYAFRLEKGQAILMHREILAAPVGLQVDHEDGDGLNNRRKNIRLATPTQNQANRGMDRRNKLQLKGVYTAKGRFRASIKPDGRTIHLGSYATPEEASAAYQGAAKVLWGEFAKK